MTTISPWTCAEGNNVQCHDIPLLLYSNADSHIYTVTAYHLTRMSLSFELYYLSESTFASYSWKSFFMATSGKNTPQYRMMLEYAPSLEDALADDMDEDVMRTLARELEVAGLITENLLMKLHMVHDAKAIAAILLGLVTIKVYSNSENFTTFLDVLKKDKETYGHILAKMKEKGVFVIIVCTASNLPI